jgi:membrane protein
VKRVGAGAIDDNITGEAAKAAFYFFLSLFPMLLVLFAFTGLFGGEHAFDRIMDWLQTALPEDAIGFVEQPVRDITGEQRPGTFSIGLLAAVWAASNFFAVIGDSLDNMFGVRDRSNWFRKRAKAFLLMLIGGALLLGSAAALLAGPQITHWLGVSEVFAWIAWPLVFVALVALLWVTYYILPAHDQDSMRRELLIGAVVGTALWLLATVVFRFYVYNIADFSRMYGFIGGIIVLMLWLYITNIAILVGAQTANVLAQDA